MNPIPVKPTKRKDWANYISPEDQEQTRGELCYRISHRLDAVVDRKGEVALLLHEGDEYQANVVLSDKARAKLAYVLLKARGKEGK
ncbi:MAG: hypothetical protein AUJ52_02035 [Elusimicrobia bacterium CG1_02_63_36]|nr:MAG: hypothetical protein AUJ52_02035 [Elusimicrobia bacterium CG1_02_63_36]PIP83516.1 MAG: hypothetical protein COR54_09155 [Elusimicrobia bacterium CG22_combo_CG10-13_8_21_14_all_63_91]PJA14323.1 MAG: hypothetical protein COX66_12715 [Elusimicrobia bacterium CG_4_10_14_0_2_um_filter_63_34]PJB23299.1 MAG: hypothetical protein CO113_18620 [Elusimicrobia bacterium CG_4_9_14_3_um_filter_62_55]